VLIGDGRAVWTCGACELTVANDDERMRRMARELHACNPPPRKRRR
jgi:hypothetical protein